MTPDARPSAFLLDDGGGHGAFAAARSLGAAGWRVGVGSPAARPLLARSRFVDRSHHVPWPEHGLPAFTEAVTAALLEGEYDLVFGAGDDWVVALVEVAEQLPCTVAHDAASAATLDKLRLAEEAEAAGLRTPRTVAATPEACASWDGPAIVKAREHWAPGQADPSVRHEATYAASSAELERAVDAIRRGGGRPILQVPVDGGELTAVSGLFDGERWLQLCQQRSPAVWPMPLGRSARAMTVPIDDELTRDVGTMLRGFGLRGLVQVQLLDAPDGRWVIDANPRFYGSLAQSRAAGVDLALAWARWLRGQHVESASTRPHVRYALTEGLLRAAVTGQRGPRLPATIRALRQAATADVHALWDPADPVPFLISLARMPLRLLAAVRRRVVARRRA